MQGDAAVQLRARPGTKKSVRCRSMDHLSHEHAPQRCICRHAVEMHRHRRRPRSTIAASQKHIQISRAKLDRASMHVAFQSWLARARIGRSSWVVQSICHISLLVTCTLGNGAAGNSALRADLGRSAIYLRPAGIVRYLAAGLRLLNRVELISMHPEVEIINSQER